MPEINGLAPIFFAHIPKCAGTSIHAVMEPRFHSDEVFLTGLNKERANILATPSRYLMKYRYCAGHLSDFDRLYKLGAASCMTTVRHPYQRLQSIMNHAIRDNWPGYEDFIAFSNGDMRAMDKYLTEQYYTGASLLSYFADTRFPETADPDFYRGEKLDEILERVLHDYHVILGEKDIDTFNTAFGFNSSYTLDDRRMVGNELGEYADFAEMFDDQIRAYLQPDVQFYETLLEKRSSIYSSLDGKKRSSWVLDWDEPSMCQGFTHRMEATLQTSLAKQITSRLIAREEAVLAVPFRAGKSTFSGLLALRDEDDLNNFKLFMNGQEVQHHISRLSRWETLFYGKLENHPKNAEWMFSFSEKPTSPLVWLNDFSVHQI